MPEEPEVLRECVKRVTGVLNDKGVELIARPVDLGSKISGVSLDGSNIEYDSEWVDSLDPVLSKFSMVYERGSGEFPVSNLGLLFRGLSSQLEQIEELLPAFKEALEKRKNDIEGVDQGSFRLVENFLRLLELRSKKSRI